MKRITILLALFTIAQSAMAFKYHDPKEGANHSHHSYDPAQARTWKFEDKSIAAEGTFLLAKAGKVFIEKEDGVVSFPIEKLSWIDQKYVNRRLKEIEAINKELYLDQPVRKATNMSKWAPYSAGFVLSLTLLLIIINVQRNHRTTWTNVNL
ncbi:MAG: hypothetical protein Roseis2KO_50370 [Roseivirga sp.]